MANTYTQIYLHVVFAVSGRACVVSSVRREELQKYITGIVTRQGQKLIAISIADFRGRKAMARFPFLILI